MSARTHKTTHPILGPATWVEMQAAASTIKRETGKKVCTWCHREVPSGFRTRCGDPECNERIWQAYSWMRCARETLRENRECVCGGRAAEVDHIIPVSLGGTGDPWNRRGLCRACHKAETARLRREKHEYVAMPMEAAL